MSDTELMDKPKAEPVRRLEVFMGTGRRRSWTAEQKAHIVAETYADGATVSAVARRHGLTPQQLFAWRRNVERECGYPADAANAPFASVVVAAPPPPSGTLMPAIEVVVGTMIVRIPVGVDQTTLQVVLRAVQAVS
jgi:transposase